MRFGVSSFCLLAVTACDERVTGPTSPLNTEFTLAPGETIAIEGTSLSVRFNRITGDNRCPADALCGTRRQRGCQRDRDLGALNPRSRIPCNGDLQPVQHDAFTIPLVQVAVSLQRRDYRDDEYRVTLKVTR